MQCLQNLITIVSVMLVKGIIAGYCDIVLPDAVPKVKRLESNKAPMQSAVINSWCLLIQRYF